MMNVICNNCVGGRIYQQKNLEYGNPFMWCRISPNDFFYLYSHYDTLNYNNIELSKENGIYKVIIDNKINVFYPHYKYDEKVQVPTRDAKTLIDIRYNKIEDYIIEKYESRLKKMVGSPIFVVDDNECTWDDIFTFEKEELTKYLNKKNCIIATCDKTIKGKNVVYKDNENMYTGAIAKLVVDRFKLK